MTDPQERSAAIEAEAMDAVASQIGRLVITQARLNARLQDTSQERDRLLSELQALRPDS